MELQELIFRKRHRIQHRELHRIAQVVVLVELRQLFGVGVEGEIERTALAHRAKEVVARHLGHLRGEHRADHHVARHLAQLHDGLREPSHVHHLDVGDLCPCGRIRRNRQRSRNCEKSPLHLTDPFNSLTAASTLANSVASLFLGMVEKARRMRPESTMVPVE